MYLYIFVHVGVIKVDEMRARGRPDLIGTSFSLLSLSLSLPEDHLFLLSSFDVINSCCVLNAIEIGRRKPRRRRALKRH